MTGIFDAKIMCRKCNEEMKQTILERNGAQLRAVKCSKCGDIIVHPADLNAMEHFKDLKGKTFSVKLRMVGNSHAVSIPKEIVDFMNEMNKVHNDGPSKRIHDEMRKMDEMVRLCFEDFGKVSMRFGNMGFDELDDSDDESDFEEEEDQMEEDHIHRVKQARRILDDR